MQLLAEAEHNLRAKLLGEIFTFAEQHGVDDDPDHEVGDLQDALRLALNLMTLEQLAEFRRLLLLNGQSGWAELR
jgi:hypothetical protein